MESKAGTISRLKMGLFRNDGECSKKLLRRIAPVVVGFLLSRAGIIGGLYPFGAACAAAAPHGMAASAVTGIIIGYIIPSEISGRLRYIATALAVAGIKWALAEFRSISRSPLFSPAAAFAGVLLTGMVVSSSSGAAMLASVMLYCAEGMLAAVSSFFLTGTLEWLLAKGKIRPDRRLLCSAVVSIGIIAIPLCRLTVFGFSPMIAVLMLCVLMAAGFWHEAGGAVAGIALGAVMALSGESAALAGICAAAGLFAALFLSAGGVMSASVFVAVCSLGSLVSGEVNIYFLIEAVIAAVAFCLIPTGWIERRISALTLQEDAAPNSYSAAGRLLAAADGLSGVSAAVTEAAGKLDRIEAPPTEQIYRRATGKICSDCAISSYCWGTARQETTEQFDSLTDILHRDGSLTRAASPQALKRKCSRWGEMTEEINRLYADHAARERARRRVSQVRSVVAEQLGGVSELLCELAEETELRTDPELASVVRRALEGAGYTAGALRCVRDSKGKLSISVNIVGRDRHSLPRAELGVVVADAIDMELLPAKITGNGNEFTLELVQKPPLRVEFGAAQHCCDGERLCGDSYDAMLDDGGGAVMLLSDGMGSGGRAAVDSAMTCNLLAQLLRAGFGVHGALRVVNSALLIKSDDESLSTVDCLRMSLFTGEVSFCKAGAAQSFVRSDGQVRDVDIPSLPLGIMRELDCGSTQMQLNIGDVILMVSDGAITEDVDWLRYELERFDGADPRSLARKVVSLAAARRADSGDDDITALVLCCRDNAA